VKIDLNKQRDIAGAAMAAVFSSSPEIKITTALPSLFSSLFRMETAQTDIFISKIGITIRIEIS
jgi:hypothetical protein